jgi:hypothetical protein
MTRWCSWHEGNTTDPVLIAIVEVGSGPSGSVYACGPCVQAYRLKPLLDQPVDGDGSPQCEPRST